MTETDRPELSSEERARREVLKRIGRNLLDAIRLEDSARILAGQAVFDLAKLEGHDLESPGRPLNPKEEIAQGVMSSIGSVPLYLVRGVLERFVGSSKVALGEDLVNEPQEKMVLSNFRVVASLFGIDEEKLGMVIKRSIEGAKEVQRPLFEEDEPGDLDA